MQSPAAREILDKLIQIKDFVPLFTDTPRRSEHPGLSWATDGLA